MRSRAESVRDASIEIPEELLSINKDIVLSMDGLTVNGLKFLTSMSHDVCYRTSTLLPTTQCEDIIEKVNEIIDVHEKEGFNVVEINCDK